MVLGKNASIGECVIIGEPPRGKAPGEMKTVIGDNAVIRSHTVIYAGNTIGDNFQTGHQVMVRESNTIGNNVSFGTATIVEHHVTIADSVRLHSRVFVPEFTSIEAGAWLGPGVVVTNAMYPLSKGVKDSLQGASIRKNAKVGANATLLPGVELGENCLVGAGSVVTKSVEAGKVVAGNPAKVINEVKNLPY